MGNRIAVIVPGILGSVLYYKDEGFENVIWGEDFLRNYDRLMNETAVLALGDKVASARLLKNIYASRFVPWPKLRVWGRLLDRLPRHEQFRDRGRILELGYDWRRSLLDSARDMMRTLDQSASELAAITHTDPSGIKFTFITHSMGGLLVRCAIGLGTLDLARVDRIIHLGTPLLGAPSAFRSAYQSVELPFLREWTKFFARKNADNVLRIMIDTVQGFPSTYQLFPIEANDFLYYSPTRRDNPLSPTHSGPIKPTLKQAAVDAQRSFAEAERKLVAAGTKVYAIYTKFLPEHRTEYGFVMDPSPGGPYIIVGPLLSDWGDGTVPMDSAMGASSCSLRPLSKGAKHAFMCDDQGVVDVLMTVL